MITESGIEEKHWLQNPNAILIRSIQLSQGMGMTVVEQSCGRIIVSLSVGRFFIVVPCTGYCHVAFHKDVFEFALGYLL